MIGETLYVYLAASDLAVASVLLREVDKKQLPVYYVSKVLNGSKSRYPNIEKLAYALVVIARKLRAYFEAHPIIVYTNALLRQIYHKFDQFGCMLKWSIELCGYDVSFQPRTAIKAQALADFLVETMFNVQDMETAMVPYIPPKRKGNWQLMEEHSSRLLYRPAIVSLNICLCQTIVRWPLSLRDSAAHQM